MTRIIKDLNHLRQKITIDKKKIESNIKLVPEDDDIAVKKIVINTIKYEYLYLFKE